MRTSLAAGLIMAALTPLSVAQNTTSAPPQQGEKSSVIFSRSTDSPTPETTPKQAKEEAAPLAVDGERKAVAYTAYKMDVHLHPAEQEIAVRALLTLKNDSPAPLKHIPLQISSTLNWERIRLQGKDVPFHLSILNSDIDHTGRLHEATITLDEPLAAGKELQLDVLYSGKIEVATQRLETIHAPIDIARHMDWDRISPEFTGLRGFGDVVWYPVTAVPAILGDGARIFDLIGEQKLRQRSTRFQIAVTVEYFGPAPNIAVLNGHVVPIKTATAPAEAVDIPQIAIFQLDEAPLGFAVPTLVLAKLEEHDFKNFRAYSRPEDTPHLQAYATAATMATPLLQEWLGPNPQQQLTIIDLPEAEDAAYETGSVMLMPMVEIPPEVSARGMAHVLAHTWFPSQREWLREGVAHFIDTLWIERQKGRPGALGLLESDRRALALAEPESPQDGGGQSLLNATSPAYYRTKATYVLWMLRDIVGDSAMASALTSYRAADDTSPEYFEKLVEQHANGRALQWFFKDWVYEDHGLPDLAIANVYPSTASAGSYLVSVDVENSGWASVEVPITVKSEKTSITERVVILGHQKMAHRIVIQGTPTEVTVNDGAIPETEASVHTRTLTITTGPK